MKNKNPLSERNIKRIDKIPKNGTGETHAFQVHVKRDGITLTRTFSDGVYGGKREALENARTFKEELIKSLPEPNDSLPFRKRKIASNTSGIPGISISEEKNSKNEIIYLVQSSARIEKGISKNIKIRVPKDQLILTIQNLLRWRHELIRKRSENFLNNGIDIDSITENDIAILHKTIAQQVDAPEPATKISPALQNHIGRPGDL